MTNLLTVKERKELLAALRYERHAKHSDRIKCILLLDTGDSAEDITHYLFLSLTTVNNYLNKYQTGGLELLVQDNYLGTECRLTREQQESLTSHLEENLYQTILSVRKYIVSEYSISYAESGVRHLLNRLGFVDKKPKAVPGKANPELQAEFLSKLEQKLSENSSNTAVFFADGTHPQHNTDCSYGWIKKGQIKEIKTNTGRQRVNINGVINAKNPTEVMIDESDSINAESTIRLLTNLENNYQALNKIYVVVDNARYYKCKLVQDYLKTSRIELLYLPPYSPNLNLIERLWRLLKKEVLYNRYIDKFSDFRAVILDFFENIKNYSEQLNSLMTLRFHLIGQAPR